MKDDKNVINDQCELAEIIGEENENDMELNEMTAKNSVMQEGSELWEAGTDRNMEVAISSKYKNRKYQERKRKSFKINDILNSVELQQRIKILNKAFTDTSSHCIENITFSNAETTFESKLSKSLITHMNNLKTEKKVSQFYSLLSTLVDNEAENGYLKWICKQLNMKFSVLKQRLEEHYNGFQDNRGKRKLAVELRQKIYDEWLANTIEPVDCRSGRQEVSIRKLINIQMYDKVINTPPLEEKINKWAQSYLLRQGGLRL